MTRLTAATDLLDEGLRFYRHHVLALLGFTLGPALAIALIMAAFLWYGETGNGRSSSWVVLPVGLLLVFPLLVFLVLGVLHAVMADEPPQARRMAAAALHRLGRRLLLALAAMLPLQVLGTIVGRGITLVVVQSTNTLELLLRGHAGLPWLFTQFCVDVMNTVERFIIFILGALTFLLPCAAVLYLLQHSILRLPRPPRVSIGVLARTLWQMTAGALLIGLLAYNVLDGLTTVLRIVPLSDTGLGVVLVSLVTVWFWLFSPPLPIWMALLYRRNREPALGSDLERRVQVWSRLHQRVAPQPLPVEG